MQAMKTRHTEYPDDEPSLSLSDNAAALCTCIACGAPAYLFKHLESPWPVHHCIGCHLEFCHPMPQASEFQTFYAQYVDPRALPEVCRANAARNIDRLTRWGLESNSCLLDYGSGQGFFRKAGNSRSWFNYDPYTPENDRNVLRPGFYDWLTLWGVIEHVPDPIDMLRRCRRLLRPNGFLALTTVSTETTIPYQYKPPEHVSYWSRKALHMALTRAGFTIRNVEPYVMLQRSDVYLNAVLRTVPDHLRQQINHQLPPLVEVPTNEVFVVAQCKVSLDSDPS